jgi:hypothetical protein
MQFEVLVFGVVANHVKFLCVRLQAFSKVRGVLEQILAQPEQAPKRPVLASVESWPQSSFAVLSVIPERPETDLAFGDAEGEVGI